MTGVIRPEEPLFYLLPDLQSGQTLTVHVQGTSSNLDPVVALIDGTGDTRAIEHALAEGSDPLLAAKEAADGLFLIWDDDSGEGLGAAFSFSVPADGDYRLIVASTLTSA